MKDWADGIWLAGVVFLIALLSFTVVHTAVQWLRTIKKPLQTISRDSVIAVDQWTAERRAGLARLNQPAAKGIAGTSSMKRLCQL